jgi:hypothetical protein
MYRHEKTGSWHWFESYLTYGNSVIPEALLYAWQATKNNVYQEIAIESFNFLLDKTMPENRIRVVSNKKWMQKADVNLRVENGGEQAIDVAYTIIALKSFYDATRNNKYKQKLFIAYNWFLGNNHLNQIIYNPCTGGCYDGLEEFNVNLNQGAESTISYLISHVTVKEMLKGNAKKTPNMITEETLSI